MDIYIKATLLLFCFICCNSQTQNKPESVTEILNAGFIAIRAGDTLLAEQKAREAYLIDSLNANMWGLYAEVYKKKKLYSTALESINKAIELNGNEPLFYASRSSIHSFLGDFNFSLNDILIAYSLDSSNLEIIKNLSSVYSNFDKFKEAIYYLDKYIKANPSDYIIYYERAVCFTYLDDYKNALESCDKALELNKNDGLVYKLRADCNVYLKKYEPVCIDLKKALELLKNDEEIEKALNIYCKK